MKIFTAIVNQLCVFVFVLSVNDFIKFSSVYRKFFSPLNITILLLAFLKHFQGTSFIMMSLFFPLIIMRISDPGYFNHLQIFFLHLTNSHVKN